MVKYMDNKSGFNQWMTNKKDMAPVSGKSKLSSFLWWMILFLGAWLIFSWFFAADKKDVAQDASAPVISDAPRTLPNLLINSEKLDLNVSGTRLNNIELKDYLYDKKSDKKISLLSGASEFAEIGMTANGTIAPGANTIWNGTPDNMTWTNSDNVKFTRGVIVKDYIITIRDTIKNNSARDISVSPFANITRGGIANTSAVSSGAIVYANSDLENRDWKKLDKKSFAYTTVSGFAGFADQYWESVVSIDAPDQTIRVKKSGANYAADITTGNINIARGDTRTIETKIFAGPRDMTVIKNAATEIPGLNRTIDYGWFGFLSRPLLWSLNALYGFVLNYGLAIILLTIALRILMWPLTRKSYTSMAAMQKMQPEMAKIQKLYKNDKARQQMELMKLYQTHKTSPMSGCLPMLLQIPIFFALYKALLISVPMRGAGFLWLSDLSVMDGFFILPIIMGATMFWQQKLQGSAPGGGDANDPMAQTQKIMKWMPIIFTLMFAWMPAGLVLYWTVSNLFGIGQIYIIKRQMK